jgi:glycosyltransferase involved in cell wall biosynthesis
MPDALPISALVLARDEAARLASLLPTLGFAREVVVVIDAATRDGSREVARRHGAQVHERALEGFGPQRQFALARCTQPWVLWIDADERLDPAAVAALPGALAGNAAGYRWLRRTWFLGREIRHCGWQGERIVRLFRRDRARFDDAPVHERLLLEGPVADLAGSIAHHSYDTWAECRDKLNRYAEAGALAAWRRGRRAGALDLVARPPLRFLRMYLLQLGVLDGGHGAAVCALAAAQVFQKYAALWAWSRDPARAPARDPARPGREAADAPARDPAAPGREAPDAPGARPFE